MFPIVTDMVEPWNRNNWHRMHKIDSLVFHLINFLVFVFLSSQADCLHGSEKRGNGVSVESTGCHIPSWYLQIWLEGERIKGITRGPFETFQLRMKSLHASTLISKRSSGSPAASHLSTLPLGASFPSTVHTPPPDRCLICSLNWSSNK